MLRRTGKAAVTSGDVSLRGGHVKRRQIASRKKVVEARHAHGQGQAEQPSQRFGRFGSGVGLLISGKNEQHLTVFKHGLGHVCAHARVDFETYGACVIRGIGFEVCAFESGGLMPLIVKQRRRARIGGPQQIGHPSGIVYRTESQTSGNDVIRSGAGGAFDKGLPARGCVAFRSYGHALGAAA